MGLLFVLAGSGFLLAAVYIKSATLWGPAIAALVTGVVSFLFGGIFLWLTTRMNR